MKVYQYIASESFAFLTVSQRDLRRFRLELAAGSPIEKAFPVLALEECDEIGKWGNGFADFIGFFSGGLLVTRELRGAMENMLSGCGEWVEMLFHGEPIYYFNVTLCLDVLDVEKTKFTYFDGHITGIEHYEFKDVRLTGYPIFKISYNRKLPPFVTDEFVAFVRERKLTGLEFKLRGSI